MSTDFEDFLTSSPLSVLKMYRVYESRATLRAFLRLSGPEKKKLTPSLTRKPCTYCLSSKLMHFLIPLPLLCERHVWKSPGDKDNIMSHVTFAIFLSIASRLESRHRQCVCFAAETKPVDGRLFPHWPFSSIDPFWLQFWLFTFGARAS